MLLIMKLKNLIKILICIKNTNTKQYDKKYVKSHKYTIIKLVDFEFK